LILSCDRRLPDQVADLRAGTWNKKEYARAFGLAGRTLGIVGLGQIGLEIAKRGKAFGMHVAAWSRSLSEERADDLGLIYCSNIINLAKLSDIVSVNVAATDETRHLIGSAFFGAMKDHASFINTSRGSVVDEHALAEVIRSKQIRAGLDVFADEPAGGTGTFANELVGMPGVYGTHHVGASTDQAQAAIAAETIRIVREYMVTGHVPNCVNRAASTPATTLLTVRHLNRPGVLAHIFYILGQAHINVEDMENVIYHGAKAACARIQLDDKPANDVVEALRKNDNVLSVSVASLRKTDVREPALAR
jgi:D-3-phosphoglycerate dehydrogenase